MPETSNQRTSRGPIRRKVMPPSRSTTARDTISPKPQLIVDLKYSEDLKIIFSIRYDPQPPEPLLSPSSKNTNIYLCAFQRDRLLAAVRAFNWPTSIVNRFSRDRGLEHFEARLTVLRTEPSFPRPRKGSITSTTAVAFNISLSRAGELEVVGLLSNESGVLFPDATSFFRTDDISAPDKVRRIKVHVNRDAYLISKHTQFLTTQSQLRSHDEVHAPKARPLASSPPEEVLQTNIYGEVMDGTNFTPYFFRNGHWIIPSDICGGMRRATRRLALTHGLCEEGYILKSDLSDGESCRLSCDGRGFFYGTICLSRTTSDADKEEVVRMDLGRDEVAKPVEVGSACPKAKDEDEEIEEIPELPPHLRDRLRQSSVISISSSSSSSSSSSQSTQSSTEEEESIAASSSSEAETSSLASIPDANLDYEPDDGDADAAGHEVAAENAAPPGGRNVRVRRRPPKRACTDRAIDYRVFGNVWGF